MSASFSYGLRARFYGLFVQAPWSLAITALIILPIAFFTWPEQQQLLLHLLIYWSLFLAIVWLVRDLMVQSEMMNIFIDEQAIVLANERSTARRYDWHELSSMRMMPVEDGFFLRFADGSEVPVFKEIEGYRQLLRLINQRNVPTQVV